MKLALRILLAPVRWLAFVLGLLMCAAIDGADEAEDWYTDGKGLGKIVNDEDKG